LAYIAEGLGNILERNAVMKFQRKNGSLFNSPSTTAAILIQNYDEKAMQYLNLIVNKFDGSGVSMLLSLSKEFSSVRLSFNT
jgi:ent-kaurene synthase